MLIPLSDILIILEKYKYWLIFPVAIIEGPIIIVISGFLVYLGFLNTYITYIILVVGDSIGDSMYYAIGRYGGNITWIKKIGYFLGYSQKIKVSLINHFDRHTTKTLLLAKFSHGLGSAVQVTAGLAKINFSKYLSIEVLGTLVKTLILFVLGFYIGESYEQINNYLQMIAITVIGVVIFIISYFTLNNYQNK